MYPSPFKVNTMDSLSSRLNIKLVAFFIPRCGLRGGYMELVNFDPAVMDYIRKLFNIESCTVVAGQLALDLMADPPKSGDPSFPIFSEVDVTMLF